MMGSRFSRPRDCSECVLVLKLQKTDISEWAQDSGHVLLFVKQKSRASGYFSCLSFSCGHSSKVGFCFPYLRGPALPVYVGLRFLGCRIFVVNVTKALHTSQMWRLRFREEAVSRSY